MNFAQLVIAIPRITMPGAVVHPSQQVVEATLHSRIASAFAKLMRFALPAKPHRIG